jgi:hypothetical protein
MDVKSIENSISPFVPGGLFTIFVGLAGLIYRDVNRRLTACEKTDSEIFPVVVETSVDVKHILNHCSKCNGHK